MTSQLRYDSSNGFILRRLISGVSFFSISFIVFKETEGGGGGGGGGRRHPPVQGWLRKTQSESNRVMTVPTFTYGNNNKNNLRTVEARIVQKF